MGGIKRRRSCRVEKMTPNRAAKAKAMMVALSISRTGSESLAQRGRIGILLKMSAIYSSILLKSTETES